MPLSATRVTPGSVAAGLWRVDDASGRPAGLITDYGSAYSVSFAPTRPGRTYHLRELVRIARCVPEAGACFPTVEHAVAALENYVGDLASCHAPETG
jgi:hypothetical protein